MISLHREKSALLENPFDSDYFYSCWQTTMRAEFDIQAQDNHIVLFTRPTLKGLVRLKEVRIAGWGEAWFQDFDADKLTSFKAIVEHHAWDYFRLNFLEARRSLQQLNTLKELDLPCIEMDIRPHRYIDLSQGFEALVAGKYDKKQRYEIRRTLEKAEALSARLVDYTAISDVEPFFEEFFKYHLPYWDKKVGYSYLNEPRAQAFFIAWSKSLAERGQLLLQRLYLQDQLVNLCMSFRQDSTLYWCLTINTGALPDAVPGIASLYLRIRHAFEMGIRYFFMGDTDMLYLRKAATHQEPCRTFLMANPKSVRGRAYLAAMALKHIYIR